jgi:hypothetical protein
MTRTTLYLCAAAASLIVVATAMPGLAANGETCAAPLVAAENTTINGNLTSFDSDSAIPAACIGTGVSGVDVFYQFAAKAGYSYDVVVKPGTRLDVAAAVWEDCTPDETPCVDGANEAGKGGQEIMTFEPPADRTYMIQVTGVDTVSGATSVSFTMRVTGTAITTEDLGGGDDVVSDDVVVSTDDGPAGDVPGEVAPADVAGEDHMAPPVDVVPTDEGRDSGASKDSVIATDTVVAGDAADGVDTGTEKASGGCGLGSAGSGSSILMLIAAFAILLRRRTVF